MRLREFRVRAFRCIRDSGKVTVGDLAVLVGKNESGKTALLEALVHLNKEEKFNQLDYCDEMNRELGESVSIVEGTFELSADETAAVQKEFPGSTTFSRIRIGRNYESETVYYNMIGASFPPQYEVVKEIETKFLAALEALKTGYNNYCSAKESTEAPVPVENRTAVEAAISQLSSYKDLTPDAFTGKVNNLKDLIRQKFPGSSFGEADLQKTSVGLIKAVDVETKARQYIYKHFHPRFVYFSEYKELHGAVHIPTFITGGTPAKQQLDTGQMLDVRETVENLFYLSDLDPKYLEGIKQDPAMRNKELRECSSRLTEALRKTWKTQRIEVELEYGIGDLLVVKVCDLHKDGSRSNVGLLSRRSEGFRWHFSFFVNFTAETKKEESKEAILLLDEPGLHLHPAQQQGMLEVLRDLAEKNQVIYTTHSPYLIYEKEIGAILTVELNPDTHLSRITPILWKGDPETITPILRVLGAPALPSIEDPALAAYSPPFLILEGPTDLMYVMMFEEIIRKRGRQITGRRAWPVAASGSSAVGAIAMFYRERGFLSLALYDKEPEAERHALELKKQGFPEESTLFCTVDERPESDIEDLFTVEDYLRAVNEFYRIQLVNARFALITSENIEQARVNDTSLRRLVPTLESIWKANADKGWGDFDKKKVCAKACGIALNDPAYPSEKTVQRFTALLRAIYEKCEALSSPPA